jgi:serine/threonine protein kinase
MTRTHINNDRPKTLQPSSQAGVRLISSSEYIEHRDRVIARAGWSDVYLGQLVPRNKVASLPPSALGGPPQLLAVKVPKSRQSLPVLVDEAKMLTFLNGLKHGKEFIVTFHGLDPETGAVVLTKMDMSLEIYITNVLEKQTQRAAWMRTNFPGIAKSLVSCLKWLHGYAVHGDIKTNNILLQQTSGSPRLKDSFPYHVVLADFGASRLLNEPKNSQCGNTWEYVAPENISSAAFEAPPTLAADVWAMGISLLAVLTGRTPYPGLSFQTMIAILREGDPIEYEKNSSLVVKERLDDAGKLLKAIKPALIKDPKQRATAVDWSSML